MALARLGSESEPTNRTRNPSFAVIAGSVPRPGLSI